VKFPVAFTESVMCMEIIVPISVFPHVFHEFFKLQSIRFSRWVRIPKFLERNFRVLEAESAFKISDEIVDEFLLLKILDGKVVGGIDD